MADNVHMKIHLIHGVRPTLRMAIITAEFHQEAVNPFLLVYILWSGHEHMHLN